MANMYVVCNVSLLRGSELSGLNIHQCVSDTLGIAIKGISIQFNPFGIARVVCSPLQVGSEAGTVVGCGGGGGGGGRWRLAFLSTGGGGGDVRLLRGGGGSGGGLSLPLPPRLLRRLGQHGRQQRQDLRAAWPSATSGSEGS